MVRSRRMETRFFCDKLLENIKTLASESYSTVNSPAQFAAVEAYEGDFSEYKAKTLNILKLC